MANKAADLVATAALRAEVIRDGAQAQEAADDAERDSGAETHKTWLQKTSPGKKNLPGKQPRTCRKTASGLSRTSSPIVAQEASMRSTTLAASLLWSWSASTARSPC